MSLFNIDFVAAWSSWIPTQLRQGLVMFAEAMMSPFRALYAAFGANRSANIYRLSHNSQVCYLEAALNDTFDATLRRIYITDGPNVEATRIYLRAEQKPRYLYRSSEALPMYIYSASETIMSGADFIVNVPAALAYDAARMAALLNDYRLASKTYQINTF